MNWPGSATRIFQDFLSEWAHSSADRTYVHEYGGSSTAPAGRFIAALDEMRSTGPVMVVAHGDFTVDALRASLGDETLLSKRPQLMSDGVPTGATTQSVGRCPNWEPKIIAAARHLATVTADGPS